ncbi:MAG: 4-alpha-glucanotransferase [Gammaproteobacteria bacterium]
MSEPSLYPQRLFRRRRAGILLHPTSLPGPPEQGDLGPCAHDFVDFLARAGFGVWQTLPLGPVGRDRSPYQTCSLLAGDPRLVSPELLVRDGLLRPVDVNEASDRHQLLRRAFAHFQSGRFPALAGELDAFREREADWLDDFTLFMAIRQARGGEPWVRWPAELRDRRRSALRRAAARLEEGVRRQAFAQCLFFRQWHALVEHARDRDIQLFGDLPIYPAHDSADVWASQNLFDLDAGGEPRMVAGVPPDAFTDSGQLWGNPVYDWDVMASRRFAWWLRRLRIESQRFALLRIDHFRGLESFWAIPAGASTAARGSWRPARGREMLRAAARELDGLNLVAEDLGVITPAVVHLREDFCLPGMRVLQFAFDGRADNPHLPQNHVPEAVVYTGTHDNDTTVGWWESLTPQDRQRVEAELGGRASPAGLVDVALESVARLAVLPMQDCLGLGSAARMNTPGTVEGNWRWRMQGGAASDALADSLRERLTRARRSPEAL